MSAHNPSESGPQGERALRALAELDAGREPVGVTPEEARTLATWKGELDTLADLIRRPLAEDAYASEAYCARAVLASAAALGASAEDDSDADAFPLAGRKVGPYQLLGGCGRGGMGSVYRAVHQTLGRPAAVKLLPSSRFLSQQARRRFQREIATLGTLHHPHIVCAYDAGEADGMHYLAMEFVDGVDLATLLRRTGPLPVADACAIVRQAAIGLSAAADRGVVHRDLKPSNLMLARTGLADPIVKILDFGLASLAPQHGPEGAAGELTRQGQILGTLEYMAPEQLAGGETVDVRADIYSLGATLYKLLTGVGPYGRARELTPLELIAAIALEPPTPLAARRPDLPRKLLELVDAMLARAPDHRPATPAALAAALSDWTGEADLAALLAAAAVDDATPVAIAQPAPAVLLAQAGKVRRRGGLGLAAWGAGAVVAAALGWLTLAGEPPAAQLGRVRDAAAWLVQHRAQFIVRTAAGEVRVATADAQLVPEALEIHTANLESDKHLQDHELTRLANLPQLDTLNLSNTSIGDEGLAALGELPALRHLFLVNTQVTDAGLRQLGRFTQLTTLFVTSNAVTDDGLAGLSELTALNELLLVNCPLTDAGLLHLESLHSLRVLRLNGCRVTAGGVAALQNALPACSVYSDYSEAELRAAGDSLRAAEEPPGPAQR
jgi:hypothetical protein